MTENVGGKGSRKLSKSLLKEMVEILHLAVRDEKDLELLYQTVRGNDAFLRAVDMMVLIPSDDPFYFARYLSLRGEGYSRR